MSLALGLLLSACGGSNDGNDRSIVPAPAPIPTPTISNTVVAYPSETAELKLYAGQSRQITLNFKTSDGTSASELALALPGGGLPAGWSISSNRKRCELVDVDNLCQIALTYAPAAAEQSSVVTFPYSYRNNKGDAGTGNVAIAYSAMAVNAATATLTPARPVRGVVGKAGNVILGFGTNDGSPATDLRVENDPASLPAGWTSAGGLDCANFGAGSPCQLALSYTPPSAAPASALAIKYGYKDSSGKQQTAMASVDYSATAPNTVDVSLSPPGVVRAKAKASQEVTLTFAPSDLNPASGLHLLTDVRKLPAGWSVKASTLPCAKVDFMGNCKVTLVYAPVPDQPAGKLDVDYAYTDATGRALTGKTTVSYASHDYRAYVADFGGVENNALTGGIRQCELDNDGKLTACVKAAGTWPLFAANNVVVYGSHAYIGALGNGAQIVPARQVTVCKIADDYALIDCAGSGPFFDFLSSLQVSRLGAFVISNQNKDTELSYCRLGSDGELDTLNCRSFSNTGLFKGVPGSIPTAATSTDDRVYVSATDFSKVQNLYSCSMSERFMLSCNPFAIGKPEQVVQRMSSGQAGGKRYLYLATSSLSDPEKVAGSVVKCALDSDGMVTGCDKGVVPPGLNKANLGQISDIHIVRNSAWLVAGDAGLGKKIYQCQIDQQTGDLAACVDAGDVEGKHNFRIAVR